MGGGIFFSKLRRSTRERRVIRFDVHRLTGVGLVVGLAVVLAVGLVGCAAITQTGGFPGEPDRTGPPPQTDAAPVEHPPGESRIQKPRIHHPTSLLVERMERTLPPHLRLRYHDELEREVAEDRSGIPLVVRTGTYSLLGLADHIGEGVLRLVHGDFSGQQATPGVQSFSMHVSCGVTFFQPVAMGPREDQEDRETIFFDGFEARLSCPNEDQTVFVFRRHPPAENDPYILTAPISAMERTVLRDLSGNGFPELLRYTRIFESGGRRELLLEAYRWTGDEIQLINSMTVLRPANHALDRLERRLLGAHAAGDLLAGIDGIMEPLDDAPPASSLHPLETVRIPRFFNIPLQLGLPRWEIDHEIALEGFIYRIRLHIQANPLIENPVSISQRNTR